MEISEIFSTGSKLSILFGGGVVGALISHFLAKKRMLSSANLKAIENLNEKAISASEDLYRISSRITQYIKSTIVPLVDGIDAGSHLNSVHVDDIAKDLLNVSRDFQPVANAHSIHIKLLVPYGGSSVYSNAVDLLHNNILFLTNEELSPNRFEIIDNIREEIRTILDLQVNLGKSVQQLKENIQSGRPIH